MKSKHALFLTLLILLATPVMRAELSPNPQNVPNRRHITSLDGNWRTLVDPYENGYYDYRMQPSKQGYGLDRTYDDKTILQEYDFATAAELHVPGDWNTQRPQLYYYEGTVWYRRHFDYDLSDASRLFLHFEAANYETRVWLNGEPIGHHVGGFTPFTFEITDHVKRGTNSVVVKVDNRRHIDAVPTVNCDWWNYGGITRSVTLIETSKAYIQDYYLQLKKDNTRILEGRVTLDGVTSPQTVTIELPELKLSKRYTTDAEGNLTFTLKAKPELWSPESPKRYDVRFIAAGDTIDDQIGFRTITTRGSDILLNGKKIFCRGVSIHEERDGESGRAYSADHARTLLGWAKDMGCNFVRLAHYPHNEAMVREAERLGLMVWSEIPVYWTISWENEATYQNAESQLTDMIERDKNRCNVIIWSIANETPHGDARLRFLTRLANKAREMDNVRLVAAAMERSVVEIDGKPMQTVEDDLGELLDLISFNQYLGWYEGDYNKCDQVEWHFAVEKPILISEFGGGALYGNHGADTDRFTEEYQRILYVKQIEMLEKIDGLAGTTPWILKDFRSPRRQVPWIQDDFNRKGLLSERGERKQAFYIMQHWYQTLEERYNND